MNERKIVVDSCCDLSEDLRAQFNVTSVPLSMILGDKVFADTDSLDVADYIEQMQAFSGRPGSAAPAPHDFRQAYIEGNAEYCITLSSNLSASYANACNACEGLDVHVFDSMSASAGEALAAMKLREMLNVGLEKADIIRRMNAFLKAMKTYFVLENLDNLVKNGRMHKITERIVSALNIRPIMGSDGAGNIALFSHARGEKQVLEKLVSIVAQAERTPEQDTMVIAHCYNLRLAECLRDAVASKVDFKRILILPTRGLSSMYANKKGIILAF